ncbi:hypothetical protein THER_1760 [Thermodesulfovibrio sp. N1]|nr:hypothetical protein THER_1760 [Thermodesulfovibrio sp. N1]
MEKGANLNDSYMIKRVSVKCKGSGWLIKRNCLYTVFHFLVKYIQK